jgi:RNA-directed DNA polymerase
VTLRAFSHHVLGFQHLDDADRFLTEFRERLAKFGLELHPDKTRRIEFGGSPSKTGNREEKGSRRRSIFWDSRISAGRTGTGAMP